MDSNICDQRELGFPIRIQRIPDARLRIQGKRKHLEMLLGRTALQKQVNRSVWHGMGTEQALDDIMHRFDLGQI